MAMAAETSSLSPFGQVYQRLVANGYSPLPISPMSKAPSEFRGGKWRPMANWQRFREAPASSFVMKAWSLWPDCNVGILTGTRATATHMVACVDFDTDDPDMLIEMQRALPPSPVIKRGKRGHSAFYLVPNGTDGFRTTIVELLTNTRQTVIPPSIHPDTGRPYAWTGSASLLDTPATALPVLGEDELTRFRDTVEALTDKPIPAPKAVVVPFPDDEENVWRRLNGKAFTDLDAWVPELGLPKLRRTGNGYKAVAHWRPSTTGRLIQDRNPNLSIVTQVGARDHGTGESYSALDLVIAALGMDLDAAFEWLSARLGLVEQPVEMGVAKIEPLSRQDNIGSTDVIPDMGIPKSEAPVTVAQPDGQTDAQITLTPSAEPKAGDELPEHLTRVPGILGEVVEWIVEGARRPSPTLALGAAITIVGTAIGQAIAGPTGSASHLYVVGLAPSGAGKDHPLQSISRIMKASNNGSLIGPSEFISMPAVIKFLSRKPLSICAMDEIGAFLKRLAHPKASAYEKSISKVLRSAWGSSFTSMMTPEWASLPASEIDCPALSIYGVSTPAEFFSALEGDDVVNGFLNRWLLLTTDRKVRDKEPRHAPGYVPPELALAIATLRNEANALTAAEKVAPIGDGRTPKRMVWNGGRPVYEALLTDIERICRDEEAAPYYARTAEMAVRLATIRAAGRGLMQVMEEDMTWGRDVAWWSAGRMAALATSYIAENDTQRLHNRVMRMIGAKGGRMSHRDLVRALKGAVTSRGLKDIMDQMLASGSLVAQKTIPPAGGTPSIIYEVRNG